MLATLTDTAFNDPDCLFAIKWDGYRAVGILNGHTVSLQSRNNKSLKEKFNPVYESFVQRNLHSVLDGEILVIGENGASLIGVL